MKTWYRTTIYTIWDFQFKPCERYPKPISKWIDSTSSKKQEVSLKKIIVEDHRAVGSLNDSFQSSNFLLAPFVVVLY